MTQFEDFCKNNTMSRIKKMPFYTFGVEDNIKKKLKTKKQLCAYFAKVDKKNNKSESEGQSARHFTERTSTSDKRYELVSRFVQNRKIKSGYCSCQLGNK